MNQYQKNINIVFLSRASQKSSIELLGYSLPIGCGGAEKNIVYNISILKLFFNVTLVILKSFKKINSLIKAPGINISLISSPVHYGAVNLSFISLIRNLLRKNAFDLNACETIVFLFNNYFYTVLIKIFKPQFKTVLTLESPFLETLRLGSFFTRFFQIVFFIPAFLVANKIVLIRQDKILLNNLFIKHKICFLPNSVDTTLFTPSNYLISRNEKSLNGLNDDNILLLYVGRLSSISHKNPKLLFESFKLVASANKKVRLLIIGPSSADLQRLYRVFKVDLSLQRRIFNIENIKNELLPQYYSMSSLLLLTSNHEGTPYVILESLACGTPVITTNVIDEGIIEDGKTGYVVQSFNPIDYAKSIQEGIELSKKIKPLNKSLLKPIYDLQSRKKNLLELIDSVLRDFH